MISTSVSHDLLKKTLAKGISDKKELLYARISAASAIVIAGYFGIYPFGFVAQVVAFAFGLAAASLFPAILLGIFDKRTNNIGAITGMVVGLVFTLAYIVYFKFMAPELNNAEHWWFGISPEGIGMIGAMLNFAVAMGISRMSAPVPESVLALVDNIRVPKGVEAPHDH